MNTHETHSILISVPYTCVFFVSPEALPFQHAIEGLDDDKESQTDLSDSEMPGGEDDMIQGESQPATCETPWVGAFSWEEDTCPANLEDTQGGDDELDNRDDRSELRRLLGPMLHH